MDQLTQQQIQQFKQAFAKFDKNNDGAITTNQLLTVMRALGQHPSAIQLQNMVGQVDADGNGVIDFSQFLSLIVRKIKAPDTEQDLLMAFKMFDENGNGKITVNQLEKVLISFGETLSKDQIGQMIREADIDHDGCVSFDQFKKIMKNK